MDAIFLARMLEDHPTPTEIKGTHPYQKNSESLKHSECSEPNLKAWSSSAMFLGYANNFIFKTVGGLNFVQFESYTDG